MAANFNVKGARLLIGEDSATIEARLLTGGEQDTTRGKLVTPPGVPGLCVTEKAAAPNYLRTEVSVPLSGDNSGLVITKPCDGGVAAKPRDSPQATTAPSLGPESNGTSTSGKKRERESENPSGIPVKRRLRLSEDTQEESVQDYDARCAELWIDGEIAACEAYASSQDSINITRQNLLRDLGEASNAARRNNVSSAQPGTQKTDGPQAAIAASFQMLFKVFSQAEVLRRADFAEFINMVRGIQREIRNIRVDQRQKLETLSLMSEKMNVIQMYLADLHKTATGKK